jgi:DNA-binding response OmpR family regulator
MDIFSPGERRVNFAAMSAVVIAEPVPESRGYLERHLANDGFDVVAADDGDAAVELAERARPDLVLLGDTSALDACRERVGNVPVIVLGAENADAVDRVRAFARGCDDFLARPFAYEELLARIRAVLRRTNGHAKTVIEASAIRVDLPARSVTVAGARVPLGGKEYELLVQLASDPHRVFTKNELLRDVWGFRSPGITRTLDSHASRLRRKLHATGHGPFVINVWGVGYKLLD